MSIKLSDFELIDPEDADIVSLANETGRWLDLSRSLLDLLSFQLARAPEAAACLGAKGPMTYRDINARANKLAHHLFARGIGPDMPVGVLFDRSPEHLIAILGILKAGGCYVPLDPQYPPDYVQQILADAQPELVVSSRRFRERLGVYEDRRVDLNDELVLAEDDHDPLLKVSPEQLACLMYTSEASGAPRGIMVPHRQILNCLHALWVRVPFAAGEVGAQKTSTSSAMSAEELFAGLLAGVPQVFFDDATVRNRPRFVHELERWGVTRLYTLPSEIEAILSTTDGSYERLRSLRHLFISSEPFTTELIEKIVTAIPWVTPWYMYRCTAISDVTFGDPREQRNGTGFVPIGRPTHNTRVFVLDEDLRRMPVGAMGEMYVDGLSLARGYHHLPELTAERFIANPQGMNGSRLYKTGDLARYLPDGSLEFLGRKEDQVRIRGYRVDVRQVERTLAMHPDIREVAVVGRQHRATNQLVAYLVPRSKGAPPIQQIREYLSSCLPAYMAPSVFQFLEALPRLPNGKVDRPKLPEPKMAEDRGAAYRPPRTETERVVAGIWSEVLSQGGVGPVIVGANQNFFDLGGHSLLAAQVFSRIRRRFEIELSISTIFQSPVLEDFAAAVDAAIASAGSQAEGLVRVNDRGQAVPLSYFQQRLWFVNEHIAEQRTSYNVAFACHVRGSGLSMAALRAAVNALVARHETLRTTFVVPEGEIDPVQRIADSLWVEVPLYQIEECEIPTRVAGHARHLFDLAQGPLLKVSVLRVSPDRYVFMVNIHHIICDGWSVGILLRDLREFYAAAETGALPRLPALPLQYGDYAVWQRQRDLSEHLAYWRGQLDGYEEGLPLPYDYPRPAGREWRANIVRHQYPANLAARLSEASAGHHVTLFGTLIASVAILLNQYTGRNDLCLGTTVASRDHLDLENLIGCFVNILAIRLDLRDNPTVETLLQRTRAQVLGAIEHSDVPFEHVLAALKKQRDSSQIPLVPVMVRHQNFSAAQAQDPADLGAGEIEFGEIEFGERTTPNELDLQFIGDASRLELVVEYAGDLFSERTIRRLIEHHQQVLQTIIDRPAERLTAFRLMPESRQPIKAQEVASAKRTVAPHTSKSVIDLFKDQVKFSPNAIACVGQAGSLTYKELDRRANKLAHYLIVRGVARETRVGLSFERSPELLVAIVGVLKAGGCYVPLDPDYPQNYINNTLADAQPSLVLSSRTLGPLLPRDVGPVVHLDEALATSEEASDPCVEVHPDQLVCIVNTSGSTGQPKGVMISHRQILNWLHPLWAMVPFGQQEIVAQTSSMAFSVSIKELFGGLLAGVAQVFVNEDVVKDVAAFVGRLEQWRVTRLYTLPYQLDAFLSHVVENTTGHLPTLRHVFITGALSSLEMVEKISTALPGCTPWFTYDCSETDTITCCGPHEQFGNTGFVPAGRPIQSNRALVLDDQLRPRPVGIIGEIYVAAVGTARGYWRQPVPTAERFIPNPFGEPGSRLFRTGDLGRYLEDGLLEILGPCDCEVKIRGHRVDIRQVEKVLASHPDVIESAVMGWPRGASNPRLIAYLALKPDRELETDTLRQYLSTNLPTYMVPVKYQVLPRLPRLPNGKLDRLSLPEPTQVVTGSAHRAPRSETEKVVSDLWADVLKQGGTPISLVGTSDNFFDLGGHSLLAIHLLAKMRRQFGVALSVRTLYEFPVLEDFAKAVDRALSPKDPRAGASLDVGEAPPAKAPVFVPLSTRGKALPILFCVHPVGGQTHFYRELARTVDQCACVYALQSDDAREFDTLEGLARFYGNEIRALQPKGTYRLLGWCSGGLIAVAIRRELERSGCVVDYLGLIDVTPIPRLAVESFWAPLIAVKAILGAMRRRSFSLDEVNEAWSFLGSRGWGWEIFSKEEGGAAFEQLARHFAITGAEVSSDYLLSVVKTTKYYGSLLAGYLPHSLGSNTYVYQADEELDGAATKDERARWAAALGCDPRPTEIVQVPGNHYTVLQGDNARHLGGRIAEALATLHRAAGASREGAQPVTHLRSPMMPPVDSKGGC